MSGSEQQQSSFRETIEVSGEQLTDTVKSLYSDVSARRVTIRSHEGKELLTIPLTVGIAGGAVAVILAPVLAAVAAIGGVVAKVRLEIERVPEPVSIPGQTQSVDTAAEGDDTAAARDDATTQSAASDSENVQDQ